jgi:hypothetical protein
MPDGHFHWRLKLAPQRIIDQIREKLGHWKLVEVTNEAHDCVQNNWKE